MENNFLVLINEINGDFELYIALIMFEGQKTNFIPIAKTSFIIHPRRPSGGTKNFGNWRLAVEAKEKWISFLNSYLNFKQK